MRQKKRKTNYGMCRPSCDEYWPRCYLHLTGPSPQNPVDIETNILSDPDDLKALAAGVELCREIGNSAALRPFFKQEVAPGSFKWPALKNA